MEEHYFRSAHSCPVHRFGWDEAVRRCSCSTYWAAFSEGVSVSEKAWAEDHRWRECAAQGGACAH